MYRDKEAAERIAGLCCAGSSVTPRRTGPMTTAHISARVVRALSSPPATTHPRLLLTPTFPSQSSVLAAMDVLGQYTNDDYSDLSGDERMDVDNDNSNSHDDEPDYLDVDQPIPASSSRPSARKVCGCRKQEQVPAHSDLAFII